MSFVPAPQQANAANHANNNPSSLASNNAAVTTSMTAVSGAAAAASELSEQDILFKMRTFDVFWVEKAALMYRDGIAKVSCGCHVQRGCLSVVVGFYVNSTVVDRRSFHG